MSRKNKASVNAPKQSISIEAKTPRQLKLMENLNKFPIVIASGPAGCGKTYVSAAMAAKAYAEGKVDQIILSRANVPRGRTLGHFPGTIEDKLTPWLMPALDVLRKFLGEGLYKYCIDKKIISMQPLETIRGRSFESAFIIIDETQNLEVEDAISIITRLGEYSTLALLGDPFQTDIKGLNGLVWMEGFVEKYHLNIPSVHFTIEDVVRSKIVKDILIALYTEYKIST